ncbi:hypothetical protein KY289_008218 [Solanum tuberosum]|nr:hypothetical protein KY289_008218 [Solanum tuberosum]
MQDHLPNNIIEHVRLNMGYIRLSGEVDKPWWTKSSNGKFTVKSAWDILRNRSISNNDFKKLWVEGLPFKINFFGWRVWTQRVPVAAFISSWDPNCSDLCRCCRVPVRESIEHLFLSGELTAFIWDYYARAAGLPGPWVQVKQTMKKWWDFQGNSRVKMVYQAMPNIILWFLWKRRNTILHGGKVVRWIPPPVGWLKCNTDSASRGNPGPSSVAFCVRNHDGNLVGAKGLQIADTSNLVAEAKAICEGLQYCFDKRFSNIIVETNSLSMVNIINGIWEVPWSVSIEVNAINRIRSTYEFSSFQEVPTAAKKIINLDKCSTPVMRIKQMNDSNSSS